MAKELLQRQIDATDCQIDQLVYELYGLTEDEIGIVEEEKMNSEETAGNASHDSEAGRL